jgi:hypothetical protein
MKPAIQALAMADQFFFAPIADGKKKITIREGYRDYTVGSSLILYYKGDGEHWVFSTTVESVRHISLRELTLDEMKADGFTCVQDAVDSLRQFYPDVDWDSDVTVISWGEVR